jgi:hypothetical protein
MQMRAFGAEISMSAAAEAGNASATGYIKEEQAAHSHQAGGFGSGSRLARRPMIVRCWAS